jgi:hypothetical protein
MLFAPRAARTGENERRRHLTCRYPRACGESRAGATSIGRCRDNLNRGFFHSVEAMHRTGRKRLSSVRLASCTASLLLAAPTQATEYGFGDYWLGYGIPTSGYTPPPGVYFSDSFYLYSGSASKNLSFPFGRLTAIGITANLITNIAAVAWYTDVKIFGGTLGFAAAIPDGSDTNSAALSFIGPLGFNRQLNQHFPLGLAAGVGRYFYQQLSGDSGSGAVLGPFGGRVARVGPLLSYTFKADKQELTLSGRWFHELDVKNRIRGDTIVASLSFPL